MQTRGEERAGGPADAIDGVIPSLVVEPDTPERVAGVLAAAARDRRRVVLAGGGTKLGWGTPPAGVDLRVGLGRLDRVVDHRAADLTVAVEAGITLAAVNRALAAHHQWLPLESAFAGATVGGTLATGESGPLRHRYGRPQDLLIGVTLATVDGDLVRAGGEVVKNVAGYDLGKLVSGSFGSLAAIVRATFKIAPMPRTSATLAATFHVRDAMVRSAAALAASQLDPLALDVSAVWRADGGDSPRWRVLVRYGSTPAGVEAQVEATRAMLTGAGADVSVLRDAVEVGAWRAATADVWTRPGVVARMGWRPAALTPLLEAIDRAGRAGAVAIELVGRAGVGSGLLRLEGEARAVAEMVAHVREATSAIAHLTLLRADPAVKARCGVWAPSGAGVALTAVKRAFDPAGILNAGRGPV